MTISLNPGSALGLFTPVTEMNDHKAKSQWPEDVRDLPIPVFDTGVFIAELLNTHVLPPEHKIDISQLHADEQKAIHANPEAILQTPAVKQKERLPEGTWRGTQLALTKIYDLIEKRYSSYMDTANFEPTIPSALTLVQKKGLYIFTDPASDKYPPHLNLGANQGAISVSGPDQRSNLQLGDIFNKLRLAQLTTLLPTLVPKKFLPQVAAKAGQILAGLSFGPMGTPDKGEKISDVEEYNNYERTKHWFQKDIFNLPNIGDLHDWYTDARFAQQSFTGTNPTTIELASDFWIKHFINAATDPADQTMKDKISRIAGFDKKSLYVQDMSYYRKAAGLPESEEIKCEFEEYVDGESEPRVSYRYGCASVCLYYLDDHGALHPLAIVIDWRGKADNSVTIYNKEHSHNFTQKHDWPWRYAKTCLQSSDWIRHEVTTHLTRTHLIEEATIVGASRTLPQEHMVFQILYPHWQKTLALNAAARTVLIPHVVVPLIGMPDENAYTFLRSEYETFDFQASYVPNDLRHRGFPPERLNDRKYHNYAYGRCILSMWYKIRAYVEEMVSLAYASDDSVKSDTYIENWCKTMQDPTPQFGANMKTFPTITTRVGLVDAITMCIHLASPQHTAVNYLQNYYQAFVINRPPCLYTPLPKTLAELKNYNEDSLVRALPMNRPQEWLLASHIPYLLSFKPGDKESLIIYAASKYHVYKLKYGEKNDQAIANAAEKFYTALAKSENEFKQYGLDTDDSGEILYEVLSPSWNAVSILI